MSFDNGDEWVVVLEYLPGKGREPISYNSVQTVVEELRMWRPAALFSPDRYALQLRVAADQPAEAVRRALVLHDRAVDTVGAPVPALARVEVLTGNEFESQWDHPGGTSTEPATNNTVLSNDVYWANRALLRATTSAELGNILASFVVAVGGQVHLGSPEALPGQIVVDLSLDSLDGGECRHAIGDHLSVSGLILEHCLPTLVDDARAALERLRQPPATDLRLGPPGSRGRTSGAGG